MSEANQSFNIAPPLDLGISAHMPDFMTPFLKGQEDLQTFWENDLAIRIHSVKQNLTSKIRSVAKKLDNAIHQINGSLKFLLKKEEHYENKLFPDIFDKIEKIDERVTKIETDSSNFAANENASMNVSQKDVSVNAVVKEVGKNTDPDKKKKKYNKKFRHDFIYGTGPSLLPIPKNYVIAVSKIPNSDAYDGTWLKNEIECRLKHSNLDIKVTRAERVPAKMTGAATKTIKIILTSTDTKLKVDQIYDATLWPEGLKISRFRTARKFYARRSGECQAVHDDVSADQGDSS